jgi:hypothetical protein
MTGNESASDACDAAPAVAAAESAKSEFLDSMTDVGVEARGDRGSVCGEVVVGNARNESVESVKEVVDADPAL